MSKDEVIYLVSKTPVETVGGKKTGGDEKKVMIFASVESAKRSDYMQIYGTDGRQSTLIVFGINREDMDLADQTISDEGKKTIIHARYVEHEGVRYRIENKYEINEFELKLTCSEVE